MSNPKAHLEITPAPTADSAEIEKALNVLFLPDARVELRSIKKKATDNPIIRTNYYCINNSTEREGLIQRAIQLNTDGFNVYVGMNPVDPDCSTAAKDKDIVIRRWMLIDLDPVRPTNTAATDAQLATALTTGEEIRTYLAAEGWADPVVAESGNGVHLFYRIDLPADDGSRDLIKNVLCILGDKFDTPEVTVDQTVFNAAR